MNFWLSNFFNLFDLLMTLTSIFDLGAWSIFWRDFDSMVRFNKVTFNYVAEYFFVTNYRFTDAFGQNLPNTLETNACFDSCISTSTILYNRWSLDSTGSFNLFLSECASFMLSQYKVICNSSCFMLLLYCLVIQQCWFPCQLMRFWYVVHLVI